MATYRDFERWNGNKGDTVSRTAVNHCLGLLLAWLAEGVEREKKTELTLLRLLSSCHIGSAAAPRVSESFGLTWQPRAPAPAGVRTNCLMVLSHLILNDMMKVRSHIAALALCLQDADARIAALAQLFFHELARKSYKASP